MLTRHVLARSMRGGGWWCWLLLCWPAPTVFSAELPSDLDAVPRNAAGFLHLEAAQLWKHDTFKEVRRMVDQAGPASWKLFVDKCAPDPSIIERVTIVFPPNDLDDLFPVGNPEGKSAVFLIRTSKPYDRLRVRRGLGIREKIYRRHLYYFDEDMWSGMLMPDERTIVIGSEDSIIRLFQMAAGNKPGPLQAALETAASGKHLMVMGLNPEVLGKAWGEFIPQPLQAWFQARCATFTFDYGKEMALDIRLDYPKTKEAAEGGKAVKAGLVMARQGLAEPILELEKMFKKEPGKVDLSTIPTNFGMLIGLGMLRELDQLLAKAPVQQNDSEVHLAFRYRKSESVSLGLVSLAAFAAIESAARYGYASSIAKRIDGKDPMAAHMERLAEGLNKYHADKGAYPPPAIYDRHGRPILSWRVALLPYLDNEAKALYSEFRLNEPWDSLHNKTLIKRLPQVYRSPGYYNYRKRWRTNDVAFVGGGAAFEPRKGLKKGDLADSTILLAHVLNDNPVFWTKPADISFAADRPLPNLFGKYRNEMYVLRAGGKVEKINSNIDKKKLRDMIRRGQ